MRPGGILLEVDVDVLPVVVHEAPALPAAAAVAVVSGVGGHVLARVVLGALVLVREDLVRVRVRGRVRVRVRVRVKRLSSSERTWLGLGLGFGLGLGLGLGLG